MSMDKDKRNTLIIIGIIIICAILILIFENGTRVLFDKHYDSLSGIVIESDLANVEVEYIHAQNVSVLVYGKKNDNFDYKVEDDILYISKESSKGFCLLNCSDRILLYLPEEFPLLNVETTLGNIDADQVTIDRTTITSTVGNIKLGTVKEANIKSDIGNVTIEEIDADADSFIESNTGNVTIKKTNNLNILAETTTGKKDIKNTKNKEYNLEVKTNIGNIKVG